MVNETVHLERNTSQAVELPLLLLTDSKVDPNMSADGVLVRLTQGLGFEDSKVTLLERLMSQNLIDGRVFAFHFSNIDFNSELSIGFGNESYHSEDFKDISTISNDSWRVPLNQISIKREKTTLYLNEFAVGSAIIDPSSSVIVLPTAEFNKYKDIVCGQVKCDPNTELLAFDCSTMTENTMPDLIFKLNGSDFTLTSKHYILRGHPCVSLVISSSEKDKLVLGNPFMKAYYTLFDAENHKIRIARARDNPPKQQLPALWLLVVVIAVIIIISCVSCQHSKKETNPSEDPFIPPGPD